MAVVNDNHYCIKDLQTVRGQTLQVLHSGRQRNRWRFVEFLFYWLLARELNSQLDYIYHIG